MRSFRIIVIGIVLGTIWYSCVDHELYNDEAGGEQIMLRWIKGHPQETKDRCYHRISLELIFFRC